MSVVQEVQEFVMSLGCEYEMREYSESIFEAEGL